MAIAKLTLAMVRSVLTAPSENTAKLTLGGLLIVTAGMPAPCKTVKGAALLIAVSLPACALAVLSALRMPGAGVGVELPPPPPQPARAIDTRQAVPH